MAACLKAIESKPSVIVGVDFGTAFSGFAFAHRDDPNEVNLHFEWPGAPSHYCKTQTSLLYAPDGRLQDWGWSALREYTSSLQAKATPAGSFMTCFKLLLADEQPQHVVSGVFPVEKLVVDYLRCLSDFIIDRLREKYGKSFSKRQVQWCLTVPAIWSDRAKRIMQLCAEKAELVQGKHSELSSEASAYPLKIVLEPEAASFSCLKHRVMLNNGDPYIVADIGGGTIDIAVHKKVGTKGKVREVAPSSGDLGGGTFVDRNFMAFLKKKIGCFEEFSQQNPKDVNTILSWWLGSHGKFNFDGSGSKYLLVPRRLSDAWREYEFRLGIHGRGDEYYEEVEISEEQMRAFFDTEVEKAAELIEAKLTSRIKFIFLVGGLSESTYVVKEMKKRFATSVADVVVPPLPGAAICRGAVAIGFETGVVLSRISKFWYGTDTSLRICWFVEKGESIEQSQRVEKTFFPMRPDQRAMSMKLICSNEEGAPDFMSESGWKKLAKYSFDIDEDLHLGKDRAVRMSMFFGKSMIEVYAQRLNFGSNREPEKLYVAELDVDHAFK